MSDVKVTLVDGAYHDVDSSAWAFEIASRAAFREALHKAGSVLLEPIIKVEVVTPEDCTGSLIGNLNRRRGQGQGQGQTMRGNANIISAMVPLIATLTIAYGECASNPDSGVRSLVLYGSHGISC
jgi:elongation factor G